MNVHLDDKTIDRLTAVAALQNTSTEVLVAKWIKKISIREAEKIEAIARNEDMEKNGGIPHEEMMDWLDSFAAGEAE